MKNTYTTFVALLFAVATSTQAAVITDFTNLDFDASTSENFPTGFDNVAGYDVPGWQDLNATVNDAGIENVAWWFTFDQYSAFLKVGDGAYNLGTYAIQDGDLFKVDLMAKGWQTYANTPGAELTVSLFYGTDPTTNILGSFNTGALPQGDDLATWTAYSSGTIAATPASVGQPLGVVVFQSSATANTFANFDEVVVSTVPEPSAALLGSLGLLALLRRRKG